MLTYSLTYYEGVEKVAGGPLYTIIWCLSVVPLDTRTPFNPKDSSLFNHLDILTPIRERTR